MNVNFGAYYAEIMNYFQHNVYIAVALAGVLLLLMVRKPRLFFTIVMIVAVNISLLYVISYTSSLGVSQKKNLIQ
ncbi:MAG: hypothetical protein JSU90_11530 [Nitrospiraceae bacterium]|nr:MAG: hypothetical protein JSU90_11530 [Nitrospiraceae bacterium]